MDDGEKVIGDVKLSNGMRTRCKHPHYSPKEPSEDVIPKQSVSGVRTPVGPVKKL